MEKLKNDEFPVKEVQIMTLGFMLHVSLLAPPKNATPFIRCLYKIFLTVSLTLQLLSLLGQIMAVYVNWGNIPVISSIISYMSGFLLSIIGSLYFLHNKEKFMTLIDLLRTEFVANMNSKYMKFIPIAERQVKLLSMLAIPLAVPVGTLTILTPFLRNTISDFGNNNITSDGTNFDRLMFMVWVPFSIEESPQFEIILFLQMIVMCCTQLMMIAVDAIFLLLMSHAAAQFKVICAMLNDMHQNVSEEEMKRRKQNSPFDDNRDFNLMKDLLTSANNITSQESESGNCGNPGFDTSQEDSHVSGDAFRLYLVECIKYHQAVIK
jgi:hypothetical protein